MGKGGGGGVCGVSARLYRATILAHCRNCALNFVIVASYSCTPDIQNFMVKCSAKQKHILHEHLKNDKIS